MQGMLPSTARWRILVIDDDPGVRQALARLIAAEGHLATTMPNAGTALEAIAGGDYDLIVCDVMLPDLDGPALYEAVKRRWPHLVARFVFMTGAPAESRRVFFRREGVPVILKPFGREELLAAARLVGLERFE
jgi:DNA-binding response OmpR family regulator